MAHAALTILADLAVFTVVVMLPALWILFTDRFRQPPDASQYAILLALALLAGVLLFLPDFSIVAGTALLGILLAHIAARSALSNLSYERDITPSRLFPGDEAELAIRLNNRKLLPLAWLTMTDPIHFTALRAQQSLDSLLSISGNVELLDNFGHAIVNKAAIGPFQSLTRKYTVKAKARGVYTLGPAHLVTGDAFGIFQREAQIGGTDEIVVYPRIYRPEDVSLPFREIMGSLSTCRSLFEDPTLIAGSRDYRPDDPLRRIHWKATARTGNLQVRIFDPSTTASLLIAVNLNTFQHVWQGMEPERVEAAISLAASLAVWALDRDYAVGLRSNGAVLGAEHTRRIAPSASPRQSATILEHLARLSYSGYGSAEHMLLDEAKRLDAGATIIFVTSIITPQLIATLTSRRLTGKVAVVYCGRFAAPVVRGLPIHLALPPRDNVRAIS